MLPLLCLAGLVPLFRPPFPAAICVPHALVLQDGGKGPVYVVQFCRLISQLRVLTVSVVLVNVRRDQKMPDGIPAYRSNPSTNLVP